MGRREKTTAIIIRPVNSDDSNFNWMSVVDEKEAHRCYRQDIADTLVSDRCPDEWQVSWRVADWWVTGVLMSATLVSDRCSSGWQVSGVLMSDKLVSDRCPDEWHIGEWQVLFWLASDRCPDEWHIGEWQVLFWLASDRCPDEWHIGEWYVSWWVTHWWVTGALLVGEWQVSWWVTHWWVTGVLISDTLVSDRCPDEWHIGEWQVSWWVMRHWWVTGVLMSDETSASDRCSVWIYAGVLLREQLYKRRTRLRTVYTLAADVRLQPAARRSTRPFHRSSRLSLGPYENAGCSLAGENGRGDGVGVHS